MAIYQVSNTVLFDQQKEGQTLSLHHSKTQGQSMPHRFEFHKTRTLELDVITKGVNVSHLFCEPHLAIDNTARTHEGQVQVARQAFKKL